MKWREFRSRNPRFRMFLIIGVVVLLVAGFFLWRYFNSYESTDDAQIDGHLNPVSARVSGHIQKLLITDNQYVQAGQPLVQIDPSDYQVLVAQGARRLRQRIGCSPKRWSRHSDHHRQRRRTAIVGRGRGGNCASQPAGRETAG